MIKFLMGYPLNYPLNYRDSIWGGEKEVSTGSKLDPIFIPLSKLFLKTIN
jgi:hypothetical protein